MQLKPAAQSVFAAQGNAQRAVCGLQRWVPQVMSLWQGRASGLGGATDSPPIRLTMLDQASPGGMGRGACV